jgi:YggT family protein
MPFVVMGGSDLSPIVILLALQFLDTFLIRLVYG